MYISFEQLEISLHELDPVHPFLGISFLAFKQLDLRTEITSHVDIAKEERLILESYYNPREKSKFYYVPLRSSTGRMNRWVSKAKYPSSGLQKTRTTSFLQAFIHKPDSDEWAWATDYVSKIQNTRKVKVPVPTFHLAVWMLRDKVWSDDTNPDDIIQYFFDLFHISRREIDELYDPRVPKSESLFSIETFQNEPLTWKNLKNLIGSPPDEAPDEGGGLENLKLVSVGPAKHIKIDFARRLNIITGDNGLGKTFLLDCAWWALSGHWADPEQPAYPRHDGAKPAISFQISGNSTQSQTINYDQLTQTWPILNEKRSILPGIVIYSRVDGSYVIWDPAKHYWTIESDRVQGLEVSDALRFTHDMRNEIAASEQRRTYCRQKG